METIIKNKWYWLTLMLGAGVFYFLNLHTSLWGDDILYALIPGNEQQLCDTPAKYLASMKFFYIDTNGRIADMINRFFVSQFDKWFFNIVNTGVFVIFIHTIVRLITEKRTVALLTVIFLYLLLLFPYPGETLTWVAGACNYLWSATMTLLLLHFIVTHNTDAKRHAPAYIHILLFIWAFIAGGMNESFSAAMSCGLVLYFIFNRKHFRGIMVTITIAYLLGLLLVVMSPAAWNRLDGGNSVNFNGGALMTLMRRFYNLGSKSVHYVTPLLGGLAILWSLWRKGWKRTKANLPMWILIGTMASVWVFCVTTRRAYTMYSIIGFIVCMTPLCHAFEGKRRITATVAIMAIAAAIWPAAHCIHITTTYGAFSDSVMNTVMTSPDGVIIAPPTPEPSRFYHTMHYDNNLETCWNRFTANKYGKKNVQFVTDSVYTHYRSPELFTNGTVPLPFVSSRPNVADTLLGHPTAGYTVMVIHSKDTTEIEGNCSKLDYINIEQHIGTDRVSVRKFWGRYRAFQPVYQYPLWRDGKHYVVLPAISDSVTRIVMPVWIGQTMDSVVFTRKAK
ncbi:MAG: hypothetical protein KBT10_01360 [Bacteroidales bacterium]|nr:hypothetical protein [Candidatus Sodaliphilus aphodohippi]